MNPSEVSQTRAPSLDTLDLHPGERQRLQPFLGDAGDERSGELRGVRYDAKPPLLELAAIYEEDRLLGVLDHGALDLGLQNIRVRQETLAGNALDAHEGSVRIVRRDRPYRMRTYERERELPHHPTNPDDAGLGRFVLHEQLHHRHGVGQERDLRSLPQYSARHVVRRGGTIQEHRIARLQQLDGRAGQTLFGLHTLVQPVPERVLMPRILRKNRSSVGSSYPSLILEGDQIPQGRHRRDPELRFQQSNRDTPRLPDEPRYPPTTLLRHHRLVRW